MAIWNLIEFRWESGWLLPTCSNYYCLFFTMFFPHWLIVLSFAHQCLSDYLLTFCWLCVLDLETFLVSSTERSFLRWYLCSFAFPTLSCIKRGWGWGIIVGLVIWIKPSGNIYRSRLVSIRTCCLNKLKCDGLGGDVKLLIPKAWWLHTEFLLRRTAWSGLSHRLRLLLVHESLLA